MKTDEDNTEKKEQKRDYRTELKQIFEQLEKLRQEEYKRRRQLKKGIDTNYRTQYS